MAGDMFEGGNNQNLKTGRRGKVHQRQVVRPLLIIAGCILPLLLVILETVHTEPAQFNSNSNPGQCLSHEGAEIIHDWVESLVEQPALPSLVDADIKVQKRKIIIDFEHVTSEASPRWVLTPAKGGTQDDNAFKLGGYAIEVHGDNERIQTKLERAARKMPPPNVWKSCRKSVRSTYSMGYSPKTLRWFWVPPLLILPIFLFLWMIVVWCKHIEPFHDGWVVWVTIGVGTVLLLVQLWGALGSVQSFRIDQQRDFMAALLMARGEEFPLRGPAIFCKPIFTGPLFQALAGLVAWFDERPQAFFVLPALSQWATLTLGVLFLRRASGIITAALFACAWTGLAFTTQHTPYYSHDFLAFPLIVVSLWALHDMILSKRWTLLLLVGLAMGFAVQIYSVYLILGPCVLLAAWAGRVKAPLSIWVQAGLLFLVPQIFTIGLFIHDWVHGLSIATFADFAHCGRHDSIAESMTDLVTNIHPFAGRTTFIAATVGTAAFSICLFLHKRSMTEANRHLHLLMLIFVTVPLAIFAATSNLWNRIYGVALLPALPMLLAIGMGDIAKLPVFSKITKRAGAVAMGLLIVTAFLFVIRGLAPLNPDYIHTRDIGLRDQEKLVRSLRQNGFHGPYSLHYRAHGSVLHDQLGLMGFPALFTVLEQKEGEAVEGRLAVWMPNRLPGVFESGVNVEQLHLHRQYLTMVYYESRLRDCFVRVRTGPGVARLFEGGKLRLPISPLNLDPRIYTKSDEVRAMADYRKGSWNIEKVDQLGSVLELVYMNVNLKHRPLRVIVDSGCPFEVLADGQSLDPQLERQTPSNLVLATYVSPARVDQLVIRLDTQRCPLDNFDVFDIPVSLPSP